MNTTRHISYSIIIPHKNIPNLLRRCLDSIPKREDVQIIIIDDNSDPSLVDFSNFPGIGEPNTEIYFAKENKGAGYARNIGLTMAKGKWLLFADADDFFNDCVYFLMDKYKNENVDLVFFKSNSVYSDSLRPVVSRGDKYNRWLDHAVETGTISNELRYNFNPSWAKFFSRAFIFKNNIYFQETYAGNDALFSTKTGHLAATILVDLNEIYCATVRKGSLDYQISYESAKSRFDVSLAQYSYLLSVGKEKYARHVWVFIDQIRKSGCRNWKKKALWPAFKKLKLKDFLYGAQRILYVITIDLFKKNNH